MSKHPQAIALPSGELQCPLCNWQAEVRHWDAGGADDGCLFCNGCNSEISVDGVSLFGAEPNAE